MLWLHSKYEWGGANTGVTMQESHRAGGSRGLISGAGGGLSAPVTVVDGVPVEILCVPKPVLTLWLAYLAPSLGPSVPRVLTFLFCWWPNIDTNALSLRGFSFEIHHSRLGIEGESGAAVELMLS